MQMACMGRTPRDLPYSADAAETILQTAINPRGIKPKARADTGRYRLISSTARTSGRSESWIGPENGVLISMIR
ncbi:hypothetical protein CI1B_09830 [Bradyrhizobium ivorense]|uniref:Uncharacterized protein n=1 Tax=Bradyrhizobium ivorense TaxID=2511166 RepID=A0A508SSP8_9BRAD|nr:hypothetical protein CI1B_09830 [Bradyrhizobium ivorense]